MSEQIFQNDSINNTAQSEVAMQANYKPYLYTAIVAIIAVGGLGYYLMPEKVIYEPGFVLEDNSDEAQENIPNLEKPIIAISGNTLSVMENGQMVQDFSLSTEGQFALHVLPSQPPRAFITDQDLNFDGRNDLGVLTSTGYSGVNYFYDYYIYNPLTNRFDKNNVLVGLASIQVNASKKQISSTYKSGQENVTEVFNWNGSNFVSNVLCDSYVVDWKDHPDTSKGEIYHQSLICRRATGDKILFKDLSEVPELRDLFMKGYGLSSGDTTADLSMVIFSGGIPDSGAQVSFYVFDVQTYTFKKLNNISIGFGSITSPQKDKVLNITDKNIRLCYFKSDTCDILITLPEGEAFSGHDDETSMMEHNVLWLDNNTIKYTVFHEKIIIDQHQRRKEKEVRTYSLQ